MNDAVRVTGLTKGFGPQNRRVEVLRGFDLRIAAGQMVAVVGPSGVGKSTLLHLLGLLDRPDSGTIELFGHDAATWSETERARQRNRTIGFVFQFHALLPELTLDENVAIPLLIAGIHRREAVGRARQLLEGVGLAHRVDHYPDQLSGGEQQRGALARALVAEPRLVLADEPTGNLDSANAEAVFDLLQQLHLRHHTTSVMVTHNEDLAARCDRVVRLAGGTSTAACSRT